WRRSKLLHLVVQQSSRHCCLSIGYIGPDGERKHRGYGSQSTRHNGGSDHYFNQCESTIRQRVIRLGLEKGRASQTLKRCHAEINTVTSRPLPKGEGRFYSAVISFGRVIVKRVPSPSALCTSIRPLCARTIFCTNDKPRPVPCVLVVKKGRNIFENTLWGMPRPSSSIEIRM